MRLTQAVQSSSIKHAHNTSNRHRVLVHPTVIAMRDGPHNGFALDKSNLMSVSVVCQELTLEELERAAEKASQDTNSPIYGLETDAWVSGNFSA